MPSPKPTISADHLERHERTQHARERAQDSRFGAGRNSAGRRRLREKAAVGRVGHAVLAALMRANGGERAVENTQRSGDERLSRKKAGVGHEIAGREIVGAIGDDVVAADDAERIPRGEPRRVRLDRNVGIETLDCRRCAVHLELADLRRAMDDLALQIRQRDGIVVDDADRAHAGGGQVHERRRTEPACTDHQHARLLERRLPGPADLAHHDVTGITFELFGAEHRRHTSSPSSALLSAKSGILQIPGMSRACPGRRWIS